MIRPWSSTCQRRAARLAGLLLVLTPLLIASSTDAQVIVRAGGAAGAKRTGGFSVRKEDEAVVEALSEFERYCGKGEWEKAVAALAKVSESPSRGLSPASDGFYVPTRVRVRQALANLPPAGREAYRLFNDAKARQLFAQLDERPEAEPGETPLPSDELARLEELFDLYFVTSIGDRVADRLGDAKFEAGDFTGAAACWDAILTSYPESSLPPLRLHAKRAAALARAGRAEELRALLALVRERFASQTVRIGGHDVVAASFIKELLSRGATDPQLASGTNAGPATAPSAPLPTSDEPLWQSVFADESHAKKVGDALNNTGWGAYMRNPAFQAPASAVDEHRIYLNWFGIGMAVDLTTGKLAWRTSGFNDVPQKLQNMLMSGADTDGYVIAVAPQARRVLLVGGDAQRGGGGGGGGGASLICLSADDGKQLWASQSGALSGWAFCGQPIVHGNTIYAAARQGQAELHLLAIALEDAKLLWTLPLGTATPRQNFRGGMTIQTPVLRREGGTVFVNTSNGAVLAVNVEARRVEWAFTFDVPVAANQDVFVYERRGNERPTFPATLYVAGSTLFVKDEGHDQLFALDLSGPSLKWRRPIDAGAAVVHADGKSVYTIGEELCCIDLSSRDMRWSIKTPVDSGDTRPLVVASRDGNGGSAGHVHLFGSRGVYDIDLRDGARAIFRGYDRDGIGGAVWRAGDRLVCVSNRAVTAYRLAAANGNGR